jgi:CRISPR/Cas system-associated exonuclease Cas4 (RecB family)
MSKKSEENKGGRPSISVNSRLTRKQQLFVRELVANDGHITLREAAINAGYSPGSSHTRAYELTNPDKSPHVVAEIKRYRNELDAKYGVTYGRHVRELQRIRDEALDNGAYSAAVQAEYRRGQAQGDIYVSKSEIRHGSIDQMSKEEVLKAIEEIKSYGQTSKKQTNPENGASGGIRILETGSGSSEEDETPDITH